MSANAQNANKRTDKYGSFAELQEHEPPGAFDIVYESRRSSVAIIAPHGGNIELGTFEIAKAIAGSDFRLYSFNSQDSNLHITSTNFDEPQALSVVQKCAIVVAIHGCTNQAGGSDVLIGGLDGELKGDICRALTSAGFNAKIRNRGESLAGVAVGNICNKGLRKKGVQLEISKLLRRALHGIASIQRQNFATAVRTAIIDYAHHNGINLRTRRRHHPAPPPARFRPQREFSAAFQRGGINQIFPEAFLLGVAIGEYDV